MKKNLTYCYRKYIIAVNELFCDEKKVNKLFAAIHILTVVIGLGVVAITLLNQYFPDWHR